MAKERMDRGRRRRPGVVSEAKRPGPGRGFWLALGVVAVLGLGALGYVANRPKVQTARVDPTLPPMKAEGYLLGSPSAPVEVIEFADFECPGCGQFATITEPDIRTRLINTGKIRMRYIDFPLPMHRNTWDASLAAACANDQGKFWEMHDQLFQNQDRWNGETTNKPRPVIAELAKAIGLDMSKYGTCMDNETHRAKVQSHLQEAERRGVNQTPSFVIGGSLVAGAIPYDTFKKLVDDALAKAPAVTDSAATGAAKGPAVAPESAAKPKAGAK
ncbi:MAG: putative oxidoreductase [Gemmatimonadetes bacterium]|nr:putative oxidoreductase [Gemmatimonadota bacterium]